MGIKALLQGSWYTVGRLQARFNVQGGARGDGLPDQGERRGSHCVSEESSPK